MIRYLKGDATQPNQSTKQAIIHVCNNVGAWGGGFTGALDEFSAKPYLAFNELFENGKRPELGFVQFVTLSLDLIVCNIIGQNGIVGRNNPTPIRYDALRQGLITVAQTLPTTTTIHGPRLGAGLAQGKWSIIEPIILDALPNHFVFIYDLP
jgi:O-acetyl-ADP-ribose deacetylase (regulator of RNase III)